MANAWEELENRCYEFLRRMYGDNNSGEIGISCPQGCPKSQKKGR